MTEPELVEVASLAAVVGTALVLFLMERSAALRHQPLLLGRRNVSNAGLFVVGNLAASLLIPVGTYAYALQQAPGLVSGSAWPAPLQWLVTFALLDLYSYVEHRLFHCVPLLWRLHRVHHSDIGMDVTTSERHHPIDMVLSTLLLMGVVRLFGPPALAVATYLAIASVASLLVHANLRLPEAVDRRLRWLVVTPPIHAMHHSDWQPQTDSNYGALLTLWDRLFGSYTDPSAAPPRGCGLDYFRGATEARLGMILRQPFVDHRRVAARCVSAASPADEAHAKAARSRWLRVAAGGTIATAIAALVLAPTWAELARTWRDNEAFQWCWLVPPAALYALVSQARGRSAADLPRFDIGGAWLGVFAGLLWWLSELVDVGVGRELALVVALQSIALGTLGRRLWRDSLPSLALLFLMVPSADLLQPVLRGVTVAGVDWFATLAGLPHSVEGYAVTVGGRHYVVIDECSGLAPVALATFLGFFFGALLYRSLWKTLALAAAAAALGIACNLLRVDAIVGIDWLRNSQMDLATHLDIQWFAMLALMAMLLLALPRLRADPTVPAATPALTPPGRRLDRHAPWLVGAAVPVVVWALNAAIPAQGRTGSHLDVASESDPLAAPLPRGEWPKAGERWYVEPGGATATSVSMRAHGRTLLQTIVVRTLAPDARLPRWNLPAAQAAHWHDVQARRETFCDGHGCMTYRRSTLQGDRIALRRSMDAAYCDGDGLMTDSLLRVRLQHAWNRIRQVEDAPRSVALVVDGQPLPFSETASALRSLCGAGRPAVPAEIQAFPATAP